MRYNNNTTDVLTEREVAVARAAKISQQMGEELAVIIRPDGYELDFVAAEIVPDPVALARQTEMYRAYRENPSAWLFDWGMDGHGMALVHDSVRFLHRVAAAFFEALTRIPELEALRQNVKVAVEAEAATRLVEDAPFMLGREHVSLAWVNRIWESLVREFAARLEAWNGTVSEFLAEHRAQFKPVGRVVFHLVENPTGDYPFAFLATYASSWGEHGEKSRHLPLKSALMEYQADQGKLIELLATVHQAAASSSWMAGLVGSGEIFQPIRLTAEEAYTFLSEIPRYEAAGILCRMPKWWRSKSNVPRLTVRVGDKRMSGLGLDALVDFNPVLSLDGEALSLEELTQLRREAEGLALIKGKWVEVNHAQLDSLLEAYQAAKQLHADGEMNLFDALRLQMSPPQASGSGAVDWSGVEVTHGEWLQRVLADLREPGALATSDAGPGFHAQLRPYQERGVAWLNTLRQLGLGACLADDMGLGKTVQVIGVLNGMLAKREAKALIVVPASLLGNWSEEFSRFAPDLRLRVLHSAWVQDSEAAIAGDGTEALATSDVLLTTYAMVRRFAWLRQVTWDALILDEAQAVKNPATQQAQAVKTLKARFKVAMTGTPVENRLSDLWSLFDFLNPGLLGTASEFTAFSKRLGQAPEGYRRLRQVVIPFILRRVKTDPTVIADLPEKIEMKTYARLTKRQAGLYAALVGDLQARLETSEGMQRRGIILASLMKLKQICNHPDQYLGQNVFRPEDSGKLERLGEIAETVYARRERMLVFTQFREITQPLAQFLESVFHHRGLTLDGQTPVKRRREIVAQFQGADYVPFMVLSIKAGGVGLNLTEANHVVHFDRWWNPAVENQATDRAFRIGQTRHVIVHKFISRGTIEEKIDAMIEAKLRLSEEVIPTMQETWITELDNRQLSELFALSS